MSGRHFPILFNVSQSEKAQFFSGCIIGEMPPIFNDFTQLHMQAFNRIGRVNHFPNFRRISRKESPAPIAAATSADDREFSAPFTLFKIIQSGLSRVAMGGLVNGPERGGSGFAFFSMGKRQ